MNKEKGKKKITKGLILRDCECNFMFYFSLPPELFSELPQRLVRQASSIANKVMRRIILGEENW